MDVGRSRFGIGGHGHGMEVQLVYCTFRALKLSLSFDIVFGDGEAGNLLLHHLSNCLFDNNLVNRESLDCSKDQVELLRCSLHKSPFEIRVRWKGTFAWGRLSGTILEARCDMDRDCNQSASKQLQLYIEDST